MNDEAIQPDIRSFIASYIDSVVQLEVLLLLHSSPHASWTAGDIARELRIDPAWAESQLADLCLRRLLDCPQENSRLYRYRPDSDALDEAVARLARDYDERRVSVINLIYSKPPVDRPEKSPSAVNVDSDGSSSIND